jgi:hypothetical protein
MFGSDVANASDPVAADELADDAEEAELLAELEAELAAELVPAAVELLVVDGLSLLHADTASAAAARAASTAVVLRADIGPLSRWGETAGQSSCGRAVKVVLVFGV